MKSLCMVLALLLSTLSLPVAAAKSVPTAESVLQSRGVALDVGSLTGALENEQPEVRENAALVLGKLGARTAIPALRKRIDADGYIYARLSAALALTRMGDLAGRTYLHSALVSADAYAALQAASFLQQGGDASGAAVVAKIARTSQNAGERIAAVREIGRFRAGGAIEASTAAAVLTELAISDADITVRRAAAEELAEYRDSSIISTFSNLRSDPDPFISAWAAAYLGKQR